MPSCARGRVCRQGRSHRCWSPVGGVSARHLGHDLLVRGRSLGHPTLKAEVTGGPLARAPTHVLTCSGWGPEEGVSHERARVLQEASCLSLRLLCSHQGPRDPAQPRVSLVSFDVKGDDTRFQLSLVETLNYFQDRLCAQSARTVFSVETLRGPA